MTRKFYQHQIDEITKDDVIEWLKGMTIGEWSDTREPIIKPIAVKALELLDETSISDDDYEPITHFFQD